VNLKREAGEMAEGSKTLLLEKADGSWQRITIPDKAKVTFGPLLGGGGSRGYSDTPSGLWVRVYLTKDHQLGVFDNVKSFREEGLEVETLTMKGKAAEWEKVDPMHLLGAQALKELGPETSHAASDPRVPWRNPVTGSWELR
jgi:hypothetical protein